MVSGWRLAVSSSESDAWNAIPYPPRDRLFVALGGHDLAATGRKPNYRVRRTSNEMDQTGGSGP